MGELAARARCGRGRGSDAPPDAGSLRARRARPPARRGLPRRTSSRATCSSASTGRATAGSQRVARSPGSRMSSSAVDGRPQLVYVKEPAPERESALEAMLDRIRSARPSRTGPSAHQASSRSSCSTTSPCSSPSASTAAPPSGGRFPRGPSPSCSWTWKARRGWHRTHAASFGAIVARFQSLLDENVDRHGGVVVDTEGDGAFCVFRAVDEAVTACVDVPTRAHRVHVARRRGRARTYRRPHGYRRAHRRQLRRASRCTARPASGRPPTAARSSSRGQLYGSSARHRCTTGPSRISARSRSRGSIGPRSCSSSSHRGCPTICSRRGREGRGRYTCRSTSPGSSDGTRRSRRPPSCSNGTTSGSSRSPGRAESGRRRLGVASAERAADAYPDGVYFVSLADTRTTDQVVGAIASTLGLRSEGSRALLATIEDRLSSGRALLVLDNFEQVIEARAVVARAARELPRRGPRRHEPYTAPRRRRDGVSSCLRSLERQPCELFLERPPARDRTGLRARTSVEPSPRSAARLDGLPLAIELAAARMRVLDPASLLDRLGRKLDVVGGSVPDLPERQRTLTATIEWSHDLLDGAERACSSPPRGLRRRLDARRRRGRVQR